MASHSPEGRPGTLYLMPVPIGPVAPASCLPVVVVETARRVDFVVAESAKAARAFLKAVEVPRPLAAIEIRELPRDDTSRSLTDCLEPILAGRDGALISEAGAPCVADPGASLVRSAHRVGIPVVPLVGPSALLLALMASGMGGQSFTFHGYLPVKEAALVDAVHRLEQAARRGFGTQIFIEAPYRNARLLGILLATLRADTWLCTATDLTMSSEAILSQPVSRWRSTPRPTIDRRPTVFLLAPAEPGRTVRGATAPARRGQPRRRDIA